MTGAMIESEIGGIFVPVSDVLAARDWYCRLLKRPAVEDVLFGHLCVLPMKNGAPLLLDSKDFSGPHANKPLFHFNSKDLVGAREHAAANGASDISPIRDNAFFTFKDLDGNLLMIADVPAATPFREESDT